MRYIKARQWLVEQARSLTLLSGVLVVCLWTLLRHITNGVNFDVVGQIGVASQWSQGMQSGVQLGATNYILKFPLYYVVNQLHVLTPMHRILLLAIICNTVTFGAIFVINEKILALYKVQQRRWFYLSMLWLATIAGKVFWVDYANSRNLETVGGLYLIYLILNFWRTGSKKALAGVALAGSITFFADPLQMFILVGGLILCLLGYLLLQVVRRSAGKWQRLTVLFVTVTFTVVTAKLITLASQSLLNVSYLKAPVARPPINFATVIATAHGLASSTLKIFDANIFKQPYGLNSIRQLLNALILTVMIALIIRLIAQRRARSATYLGGAIIVANYLLYIASGQVLQWETSRYLIMVPLIFITILAVQSDQLVHIKAKRLAGLWFGCLGISTLLLLGALVVSWPNRHSKDAPIYAAVTYMSQHQFKFALASREIGITTTYFSQGTAQVLPMACTGAHTLKLTNLFYDNASFNALNSYNGMVPILVGDGGIPYGQFSCSQSDIIAQFGEPNSTQAVPGIGSALLYDASRLKRQDITGVKSPAREMVAPVGITTLAPLLNCENGTTDVFVAHPDDDILFMNPALEQQLLSECLRTTYVTAADDGLDPAYWQGRERGIEAAYALMAGAENSWLNTPVIIDNHHIMERVLVGRPSLALLFLRLPDGNLNGDGFAANTHQSLARLSKHKIKKIYAVDYSASYSNGSLIQTLAGIIKVDQPTNIYTQLLSGQYSHGDHSDHRAVGRLATQARIAAQSEAQLSLYFGYPGNTMAGNLSAAESARKRQIFDAYASADTQICRIKNKCLIEDTYGRYLSRSYKIDVHNPRAPKNLLPVPPEIDPNKNVNDLLFH